MGEQQPATLEISPPSPGAAPKGRIFLSRSSTDRAAAIQLIPQLQGLGYEVWSQDNSTLTGDDFRRFMDRALVECRCTVALLSNDYLESRWCRDEALSAHRNGNHRLIPLIIEEGCRPDGLIASFVYLDVVTQLAGSPASVASLVDQVLAYGKPLEDSAPAKDYLRHSSFVSNLAFDDSAVLVGREAEIQMLCDTLAGDGATVAITAIAGMGGVGKSWLARVYAIRHRTRYRGVWLVRAEKEADLVEDLAALGSALNPDLAKVADRTAVAREALQLVANSAGRPFLLIFDNAETPDSIKPWRPTRGAHVLVTSRWADWKQSGAMALPLETLTRDAAIALLLELSPDTTHADAARVAEALDDLPLALTHAGVVLRRARLTADEFLADLGARLSKLPLSAGDYRASVRAALEANLHQLGLVSASAPALLEIAAVCAPDDIPVEIWETAQAQAVLPSDLHDKTGVKEAVAALESFSLARVDRENPLGWTLSLHRLVQQTAGARLNESGRMNEIASATIESLAALYPDPEYKIWPRCAYFQPHVDAALNPARDATPSASSSRLLWLSARFLWQRAHHAAAESSIRRAVVIDQAQANVSFEASQRWSMYAALVSSPEEKAQLLDILREQVARNDRPGGDRVLLARDLSSLAKLLQEQMKYDEAEPMLRRVVEIFDQFESEGSRLSTYGVVLADLGHLLQKMGKLEEAEKLLRGAVTAAEERREPGHPHIGERLYDLADLLLATGRTAEAEPMLRRALDIEEKSYGKDNPTTLATFARLAKTLSSLGKRKEAEPMIRRALELAEASGAPADIVNRNNDLGMLLKDDGRAVEAEPFLRRAVQVEEVTSGPDSKRLAGPLNNLGLALLDLGRDAEAETLTRRALALKEAAGDTSEIPLYAGNLALVLEKQYRWDEAIALRQRAFEIRETILGPSHPDIGHAAGQLGELLSDCGRRAEAKPYRQRALSIAELEGDPETIALAAGNLGILLADIGKLNEAEPLMQRALRLFEELHPGGHDDVDTMRAHLGGLHDRMERANPARPGIRPSAPSARSPAKPRHRRWVALADVALIVLIVAGLAAVSLMARP